MHVIHKNELILLVDFQMHSARWLDLVAFLRLYTRTKWWNLKQFDSFRSFMRAAQRTIQLSWVSMGDIDSVEFLQYLYAISMLT